VLSKDGHWGLVPGEPYETFMRFDSEGWCAAEVWARISGGRGMGVADVVSLPDPRCRRPVLSPINSLVIGKLVP
jgi:hypothetical protein